MAKKLKKKHDYATGSSNHATLSSHLLLIVILTSITVFPFIFDSFTVSKLLVASVGLFIFSVNLLRLSVTTEFNKLPRHLTGFLAIYSIFMVISWSRSGMPFLRGAFGQFGRGNGLFYYGFGILIFIFAAKTFDLSSRVKMHQLITYFSWFMGIYAILQRVGIDIAKLDTRGISPVVLTFGNSNFSGGMLSVLFGYHLIYNVTSKKMNPRTILLLVLLFGSATFAAAVQGYMIIAFTCCLSVTIFLLQKNKLTWVPKALTLTWLIGLITVILGVMGKFILARVFARNTFQARIEYWKIAISVIKDHLLLGAGPDKLYDVSANYMSPGSLKTITLTRMDNAHNWYLNLAANYGIITLIFLLLIFGYVLIAGIRLFIETNYLDAFSLASFTAFVAMFIDGLVSLEQPGIGVWLYLFAGVIVGTWLNYKKNNFGGEQRLKVRSKKSAAFIMQAFLVATIAALAISNLLLSNRVIGDALLRTNVQTQLIGKGTPTTLQQIGSDAITLRAEPEYAVQALKPLADAGAGSLINNVSKASYDYYPNSIQATLIRADVLVALGRVDESCPLRIILINNTPWDMYQLKEYLTCLVSGLKDPNNLEAITKASVYFPAADSEKTPVIGSDLDSLKTQLEKSILAARVNFLLGVSLKANQEKAYALNLLSRIQELEKAAGVNAAQPDRNNTLKLLNF